MTQEEKQLLLKDLCARLPYEIIVECSIESGESMDSVLQPSQIAEFIEGSITIKPYLRPLSSMTKEEREYLEELSDFRATPSIVRQKVDFYLERHLDYRGLIPMGLALEAPEGMYKTE